MWISCIQANVETGAPDSNYANVCRLIETAAKDAPDVILLPETWNTGFFPREGLPSFCDAAGARTAETVGALVEKFGVNIVAGSVSDLRDGKVYNSAYVFDRRGRAVARYDKTHLFSPSGEDEFYCAGRSLCRFALDGIPCALLICYDIRFPELCRALALEGEGIKALFLPSQWPAVRLAQLKILRAARAVENQLFLASCNAFDGAEHSASGGGSAILDPLGTVLAEAGSGESIISARCDMEALDAARRAVPVYKDLRRELCSQITSNMTDSAS